MKIKICRTCGAENSPSDLECRGCLGDISRIRPVEKVEKIERAEEPHNANHADVQGAGETLVLASTSATGSEVALSVRDGDILGRDRVGKDFFAAFGTVSREHAKITCAGGIWVIEDAGSTNGTHVNGRKLETGQKHPLQAGDIVALSKSCEFLVRKETGG